MNCATMVTPGIFFSKADDLKSNNPDALVPTTVILPSKYSGSTVPSSICHAWQILDGTVDPEYFDGKITVVGTSASGLFDLRSSALEKNIPGVTIVAQFIQQIVSGTFLQRPDWLGGLELISGLLLSIIITRNDDGKQ